MTLPTLDEVMEWPGLPVHDADGAAMGTCRSVYADDDTRVPEWVEVAMPEDGIAFAPTLGATVGGGVLRLTHSAEAVARSPRFAPDAHLSPSDEKQLYEHYGVPYSKEQSDTLLPAAADGDSPASAPPAAAPRRLRRIEPRATSTPPPTAPPPAPRPVTPVPVPPPSETGSPLAGKAKPLAAAAAVPLVVAAVRRSGVLGRRKRQERVRRQTSAVALLAPLAAGVAAKALQRSPKKGAEPIAALPPVVVVEPEPVVPVVPVDPVDRVAPVTTTTPTAEPPSTAPY